MGLTHKQQFNKRHGFNKDEPHSLAELATISGLKLKNLKEVFKRGIGAYGSNPSSVRPHITSAEEWGQARVLAYINKIEKGINLNHDTDLIN